MHTRNTWNDETMLDLRQSTVALWANNWPGLLLLLCAVAMGIASTGSTGYVIAAVLAIGGMVLVVRNFRMGVTANAQEVVIRGLFLSRSIPRHSVVELTDTTLSWKSPTGATRRTPITAFTDFLGFGGLPPVKTHNAAQIHLLGQFLGTDPKPL